MTSERQGFVSIRNEDGTQWHDGFGFQDGYRYRRAMTEAEFKKIEATVEDSKRNDNPDDGFFGLWNLTFTPCSDEEALAQRLAAERAEAEEEREHDPWDDITDLETRLGLEVGE